MLRTFLLLCAVAWATAFYLPSHQASLRPKPQTKTAVIMVTASEGTAPDTGRRILMNALLAGATAVPGLWLAGGYAITFFPVDSSDVGGGITAHDALGKDVSVTSWLMKHAKGSRQLVEGLHGDPTYLIVDDDRNIEFYALNAVCTHLGCVVPWNTAEQKFVCPCHGSQYDPTGKVVRGPAPLSLALAHVNTESDKVVLTPWTETDFRNGLAPWWC